MPGELTTAEKQVRSYDYISTQRHKVNILSEAIKSGAADNDIKKGIVNPAVNNVLKDQNLDINRVYINIPALGKVRPIHIAVLYGDRVLVQYMLNRGASINAPTQNGKTAQDLVIQNLTGQQIDKLAAIRSYLTFLHASTGSSTLASPPDAFEWTWLDQSEPTKS